MKSLVPEYIQKPDLPITISVIGAGGSGTMFLQHLARVVHAYQTLRNRRICVIVADGDNVSSANVGRQAFGPNEIGQNKANLIVSRINRFYGFSWLCKPAHFMYPAAKQADNQAVFMEHSANFLISAVDNVAARKQIQQFFLKGLEIKRNPEYLPHFWLDMGNSRTTGRIVVGCPDMGWPDILSYEKSFEKEEDEGPSCSLAMALNRQDLFINPACALVAAKWLWECLMGKEITWRGAFLNLDTFAIRKLKITPDANEKGNPPGKQQIKPGAKPARVKKRTGTAQKRKSRHRTGNRK